MQIKNQKSGQESFTERTLNHFNRSSRTLYNNIGSDNQESGTKSHENTIDFYNFRKPKNSKNSLETTKETHLRASLNTSTPYKQQQINMGAITSFPENEEITKSAKISK